MRLDELIRAVEVADNGMLNIEELTERDLERIKARYAQLARAAREGLRQGLLEIEP